MSVEVVHSSPQEEKLMDEEVSRFRAAAARENRGRRARRRRYSPTLQRQAVAYSARRRHAGETVQAIAAALGVAPWSLQRWTRRQHARPRFRPVALREAAATPAASASVVITVTAAGPRVEGLTVETAAQLLARLR